MTAPRPATIVIALLLLVGLAWGVTLGLERIFSTDVVEETAGSGPAPARDCLDHAVIGSECECG